MKTIQNILLLISAVISCPVWSQDIEPELPPEIEPAKEYVILDTAQAEVYYSALPYEWRNLSLDAAGVYSDTVKLPEITDKDTIYTINLVYRKEYIYRDTTSVNLYPPQLPYEWHNQSLTASGIYSDTVKTSDITIADTIYALNLIVKEYIHIATQTGNTCANELPFRWRKHEYTLSGTYKDTIKVKDFTIPDTVYTLQLKVGSLYEHWEHFEFCPGQSVTFRGKVYTETGTDTIYLPSTSGCDSIIIVQIVAHSSYIFTEEAELCTGSSYIWTGHFGDKVYTQPGVYYDSLTTIHGCDSVYELRLFVGEPDLHKDTVIICEEDLPYKFGKHWLTKAGEYFDTIPRGRNLCDSIIQLELTVLKDKRETKTVTFCQGTGVRHNGGELFYDARTYVDTLRTGEGCYNIVTTVYTPGPVYKLFETIHCKSTDLPYTWHNKSYSKAGVYQDKHLNMEGCDSIWELHLLIDYDTFVDSIICDGDTVFYKGQPIFSNCTIIDSLISKMGGDSVIHYNFQIAPRYYTIEKTSICSNEYIPWPGHEDIILHEEGAYYDRYQTVLGCDSIFEIDVTVNKTFSKDTFVAISAYHAVDSLPFIWYDGHNKRHELTFDTVIIDTLGHTPLTHPSDYLDGDIWYRALSGGCDSTVSIELMIVRKYSFDTIPLCPNSYVIVDGRRYDQPGDYEHWLLSSPYSLHNDSIHYFHIYEAPTYNSEQYDEDSICSNETPYLWYSRVCYTTGEYTDTIPSIYGCDSIVHLHLKVKPAYYFEEIHNVCTGDSVWVNGRYIHEAGIYYDSLKTKAGCDSVYQIVLNHVRTYFLPDTAHFKQGGTYKWHKDGQPWILSQPGVYFDSCKTVADGCDSIHRLLLIEDKSYFFTETKETCENDLPFHWRNMFIYSSGTYYDSLGTQYGMDSVYKLNLTVYPQYHQKVVINTCSDVGYTLNNKFYAQSGIYFDTLHTEHGCDSIFEYHINLGAVFLVDEQMHMGPKTEIEWHGMKLTAPGVYMDTLTTVSGCDSIIRLTLKEDPTYHFYDTIRVCRSEVPFLWQGNYYYNSGDYEHPYFSQFQMDSVHHLNLTVDPIYEQSTRIDRCLGDNFTWRGQLISKSGEYSDTLRTDLGCDSIVHTIVNFHPTYYKHDTIHLINGSTIKWHGKELSVAGTYYDSLSTVATNCDSIFRLDLLLADTFSSVENVIVCEEDLPYLWHGQQLMTSGDYADRHHSVHGADSSYYIHFFVAPKYEDVHHATLCHGGQITHFGRVITQPGTYSDTLLSTYGCDSIQTLIVNWAEEKFSEQTIHICHGEKYVINGRVFTQSGIYDDTLRTADGCDSVVRYSVQVMQKYYYENSVNINPRQQYIWTGHKNDLVISKAGTYIDSLTSIDGCDSVFVLTVTINPEYLHQDTINICANNTPCQWRGKQYTESGTYDDTLKTKLGCDSIFRLFLTIHDVSLVDQYYDFCLGQSVGIGGKTFTTSSIYYDTIFSEYGCPQVTRHNIRFHPEYRIKKTVILSEGEEYDFYGRILNKPGTYTHNIPTTFGCDSMIVLTISFCAPQSENIVRLNLCEGDTIRLGDTIITKAGQYYRTYPSKYGCDSTVHYIVKSNPTYHWTTRAIFCPNESYQWFGHLNDTVITKPGLYQELLKTVAGCDSIYSLILTASPSYLSDTTIYVCKDEVPYKHKGLEYYTDRDFVDSMRTQGGCDSISITRYRLNNHCSDLDLYTRCEGDELIVDNKWIVEDGEYRILINGDSLHRFSVLSHPHYDYSVNVPAACDSLFYEGQMYYARGFGNETFTVDRHLRTIYHCDSTEHVTMTIYQSAPTLVHSQTIYNYASVLFGGELYNTPGTYTRRYHTIHGCDSTCILNLDVIYQDSTDALHYHYCQASKDNIEIFGKLYHPVKDTIIFDTTAIPNAGMFIIKKAIVRVSYPFTVTSVQTESEVCSAPNISFDILLGLEGSYPEKYELDFLPSQLSVSPTHQEGLLNDQNTINIQMDGRGLCVNPGLYPYQLKLTANDCHMSDTIIQSSIIVRYPDNVMEANWNNVVALVNEEYNEGRWKFLPPYEWQVLTEGGQDKTALINPNSGLSYLYSDYLESGDRVVVSLRRDGYDKAVPSCEFIFYPVPTEGQVPILVYPTAARKATPITIESSVSGQYILFNNAGQSVHKGSFNDGKQTFTIPAEAGCYLLQLQPNNEAAQIKKIIVY